MRNHQIHKNSRELVTKKAEFRELPNLSSARKIRKITDTNADFRPNRKKPEQRHQILGGTGTMEPIYQGGKAIYNNTENEPSMYTFSKGLLVKQKTSNFY